MSVLLCHNNEPWAEAIIAELDGRGHRVLSCNSLSEALEYLAGTELVSYAVLSDRLPGGEGVTGLQTLRMHHEDLSIILVLNKGAEIEAVLDGFRYGADFVLEPPVSLAHIPF